VADRKRWNVSFVASLALHVAVFGCLLCRPKPVLVMPSDVALGVTNSAGGVIYLAPVGVEKSRPAQDQPKLALHRDEHKLSALRAVPPTTAKSSTPASDSQNQETLRAGSAYGSRTPGMPLTGHEVIPALPQVFPDPDVSPADLPDGLQGDVVVEVTIDERGNVIELKLIRGIGYGIEDRVLAALRRWHFKPASKDGVTIASQHIVTFHYPS